MSKGLGGNPGLKYFVASPAMGRPSSASPLFSKGNESRSTAWSAKSSACGVSSTRRRRRAAEDEKNLTRDEKRSPSWRRKTPSSSETSKPKRPSQTSPAHFRPPRPCNRSTASRRARSVAASRVARTDTRAPAARLLPDIDRVVEHKLAECPTCHNPLGEPCGKHSQIVEDIPPVKPDGHGTRHL